MKFNFTTTFPTTLDSFTNPTGGQPLNSPDHAGEHANANDAIAALEAKVGINSSAVNTTHDYKLSGVTTGDKAVSKTGTETLTNKSLTSPIINVTSDATGDLYYRNSGGAFTRLGIGSSNQILAVVAGIPAWISNPSAANSSSTVAGLVELATAAEITAGTATGGSGAALVVTPDQLALSAPTFSGANLTNMNQLKITRLAGYSPASNTTENTVFTTTITGGLLSSTGMIRFKTPVTFTTNATAETWTLKIKYGGTTLFTNAITSSAIGGGASATVYGHVECIIANNSATNSQNVGCYVTLAPQFGAVTANVVTANGSFSADTTSAIDTTANQTLTMTVTRTNGAGGTGNFYQTIVETIKN